MDPLAQLQDIHLPDTINQYPVAIGWWILASILLVAIIVTVVRYKKAKQKRYFQQLALKQLATINNPSDVISLIKAAALQYFPRQNVAKLHGSSLQLFLIATLPESKKMVFQELIGNSLENIYKAPNKNNELYEHDDQMTQAAHYWITHALPPKPLKKTKNVKQNEISGENA